MIGQDLVDYVTGLRARLNFVAQHAKVWTLGATDDTFKVLFMPRTEPMPDEASAGLDGHVIALGLEEEVLALIYPDSRGEGYGMRRFNDNQRMDFSPLEAEADVHFAHARGFIAKTSSADVGRLKALVNTAYIG